MSPELWLTVNVSCYDPLNLIVRSLIGWQEVTNQKQVFIKCFQPHFKINILTWCALGTRASEHHSFQWALYSTAIPDQTADGFRIEIVRGTFLTTRDQWTTK